MIRTGHASPTARFAGSSRATERLVQRSSGLEAVVEEREFLSGPGICQKPQRDRHPLGRQGGLPVPYGSPICAF